MRLPFPPHPHLAICCLSDNSCLQVWEDILFWFWFAFLWWLVMLSTFSCVCSSSECLPWWKKHPFRYSARFLSRSFACFCVVVFFHYWVTWVLCILWILTLYQTGLIKWVTNIFSHSAGGLLTLLMVWFPWLCRSFLVWYSPICLLLLLFPLRTLSF